VNILRVMNDQVELEGRILYHHADGPVDLATLNRRAMRRAFRTRCPIARADCADHTPPLEPRNGRQVACPYAG
jgi:hypothetical protein